MTAEDRAWEALNFYRNETMPLVEIFGGPSYESIDSVAAELDMEAATILFDLAVNPPGDSDHQGGIIVASVNLLARVAQRLPDEIFTLIGPRLSDPAMRSVLLESFGEPGVSLRPEALKYFEPVVASATDLSWLEVFYLVSAIQSVKSREAHSMIESVWRQLPEGSSKEQAELYLGLLEVDLKRLGL